jgi:CRP-like cAMP-binding protein
LEIPSGEPSPLDRIALFRGLDPDVRAEIAAGARTRTYHRGELLAPGERIQDAAFLVARGRLRLLRVGSGGGEVTIEVVRVGEPFWLPAPDGGGAPKSLAQALSDGTVVLRLPGPDVLRLVVASPERATALLEILQRRLGEAYDRIEDLALYDVRTRLAHALARIAPGGPPQIVAATHEELAAVVGSTRERVTKELRHLRAGALITYRPHRRGITILDADRLAAL